jgi:hypothetical protein
MSNNNLKQKNEKQTVLGGNTIIQFTLKGLISATLIILGIFYGFYEVVIQPDLEQTAKHQKELYKEQKSYINREFQNVNNKIDNNTKMIEELTDKFRYLNKSVDEIEDSGGSFGSSPSIKNENSAMSIDSININLADKGN